ncbi:MAG: hypothetical protein PHY47_28530 [Lachnospiraceae bacterium]|nr:hypothetical protein [Lachnospiraceae bacterium]
MGKNNTKPLISISGRRYRIYVSRDIIRLLGQPSHICIYMNEEYNSIALGPCSSKNVMSFKVPEKIYAGEKADFTITSIQFVSDIMRLNHLNPNNTYRMMGEYLEDKNMITFHFSDAQIVYFGSNDNASKGEVSFCQNKESGVNSEKMDSKM